MADSFTVSDLIPASPERIYSAWLDATTHTAMTGGAATVEARVGGRFTAWDGYIEGTTLELSPGRKIVQAWRSADFPEGAGTSRLEIALEAADGGTRVTLHHTEIPAGQGGDYEQGWRDHYFAPMRKYFSGESRPATLSGLGAPPPPPAPQPIVSLAEPLGNGVSSPAQAIARVERVKTKAPVKAKAKAPVKAKAKAPVKAKAKAAGKAAKKPAKKAAVKAAAKTAKKPAAKKAAAKKAPAKKKRR
jgi:uncharacterized protein YndB with AHSA1/START domain